MFKFQSKQESFKIGDVSFGGQPGKRRTVMVGSLFYPKHGLVSDRLEGKVDKGRLTKVLDQLDKGMSETGAPGALMLFAETEKAIASYLEMMADITKLPLFVDSPSREVRLAGMRKAKDMGILDRTVYNTLNAGATVAEMDSVRDIGVRNAVLMSFNPMDLGTKGKIYLLEDGGGILPNGLIQMAKEAGVKNILLDLAVLSASEQNAGAALRALVVSKAKWGLPSGCALHNAVESYGPLVEARKEEPALYRYVDVASTVMPIMAGSDFVMYGPAEYARRAMHAAAFADEMLCQSTADLVYDVEREIKH